MKTEDITKDDLAYASPREKALIAVAIRAAAESVRTEMPIQTHTESYARSQVIERLNQTADQYEAQAAEEQKAVPTDTRG